MPPKEEAALASAAATLSDELHEAGPNVFTSNGDHKQKSAANSPENHPHHQHVDLRSNGPSDLPPDREPPLGFDAASPTDGILSRLGEAVLIPIHRGEKRPSSANWQKTTLAAMADPAYLAELNAGGNIGVVLGVVSGGLCTIDIDHDDDVEPFLALNPRLRQALRTRRARGANIWVRIEGGYPPLTKLATTSGDSWGEWRAEGGQTVIYGMACDAGQGEIEPVQYKFLQDGKPVVIRFDEIFWPEHLLPPWTSPTSSMSEQGDVPMPESSADDHFIILPSGDVSIRECADRLFLRIAPTATLFHRSGSLVETLADDDGNIRLHIVSPAAFRSRIEAYGKVMAWRSSEGGRLVLKPVTCPEETAKALIATQELREHLPRISTVVGCPVLVQTTANKLAILPQGYHPDNGGILVTGGAMPLEVTFDEAVPAILALLDEYDFQSAGDRSRAIAQFITPALKIGGLLQGLVPVDVAEADQSQSGKTYRQRVVAALYNETPRMIARRDGGVGSVDESFGQALIAGRPFIQLDNLRGKLDSQYLESFLTAIGGFPARVPYHGEVLVDPSRFFLQLTSNGVETSRDLANRSCIIRIRKRHGHAFRRYEEGGDLLGHVRARQAFYLGCVFAVVRRWMEHGKPRTEVLTHDFRDWAQPLDWIVQNLFGAAPILDGHQGAQDRVSNPALTFLRIVALHVKDAGRLGEDLPATAISELCEECGLAIPNLAPGKEDHAARQIGILLGRMFRDSDTVQVDDFSVTRTVRETARGDGGGRHDVKFYTFSRNATAPQGAPVAQA